MRLPVSKVYRAFSELDRFSDAQCEAWVARARRGHVLLIDGSLLSGLALAAGVTIGGFLVSWPMLDFASRLPDNWWGASARVGLMVVWLAAMMLPGLAPLLARDWSLRWCIRMQLAGAACVRCRYSLLGLRVKRGEITCSECGEVMNLAALGLTPEDIIARPATNAAEPEPAAVGGHPPTT
ncbi:MAG: hypothetical protein AB7K52_13315 [Phycisphaerales bacterium]